MKLVIVSTSETDDVRELLSVAPSLGIECSCTILDSENVSVDADVVYWRSAPITKHHPGTVGRATVMQQLSKESVLVNDAVMRNPLITKKSFQQSCIEKMLPNVGRIPTYLAKDHAVLRMLVADQKLAYPIIAKPDGGSQGNGVELIESEADFEKILDPSTFVFQNFIPNTGDFRVFVVGGVAVDVVKRSATESSTKTYLNNLSQGGIAEPVSEGVFRKKLLSVGERIAMAFDLTISGVDLIQDSETGEIYFMEINTVPQWTIFKEALSVDVTKYILMTLKMLGQRGARREVSMIKETYDMFFDVLGMPYQFHYASRMFLWTGDEVYVKKLEEIYPSWIGSIAQWEGKAKSAATAPMLDFRGGQGYRKKYREQYYSIYKYNAIFFKLLFHETVFKKRLSSVFDAIDTKALAVFRARLLADPEALFGLSTIAINFLYHCEYFFDMQVDVGFLCSVTDSVSLENATDDLHARLYFLTHIIIGASHFYATRTVSDSNGLLRGLVVRAEELIAKNYVAVSLDTKCEFVVCCRLLGYESPLIESIHDELCKSFSSHGNYGVDCFNLSAEKIGGKGMRVSEHRNVLAIMAFDKR